MPISKLQSDILRLIAANRDPESFVAGGVPINRSGPRYSEDLDIFHHREDRVAQAALGDARILAEAGYEVVWLRQQPATYGATIRHGSDATKLEWVADSDYRFFPVIKDEQFGYVLHVVDLAINKAMAAASRREARDIVDLLTLHDRVLPIGALVWAAAEVAPGYTPEGLIAEIRRNARYPADELRQLAADPPVEPDAVMRRLRAALDEAEQFVSGMPSDKAGLLFLRSGRPIQPDPSKLDAYTSHGPSRRGHWPSSPDITAAMLAHLQKAQM
ncbi:MAG: hypothetical protein ACT4N2_10710 [Hyphomicrobium sp.]